MCGVNRDAWNVKPDGKAVRVYKNGELYTTKTLADVETYRALIETAPKSFKLWTALEHYVTTGEKEFRL